MIRLTLVQIFRTKCFILAKLHRNLKKIHTNIMKIKKVKRNLMQKYIQGKRVLVIVEVEYDFRFHS